MIIFFKKYKISIALSVVILILCFMDTVSLPKVEMTDFDKLAHFLMFGTLGGCVFFERSDYFKSKVSNVTLFLVSFLFPTLFSGLIELGQEYFTSYRSGDWRDFLFDGMGASVALIICFLINRKKINCRYNAQ